MPFTRACPPIQVSVSFAQIGEKALGLREPAGVLQPFAWATSWSRVVCTCHNGPGPQQVVRERGPAAARTAINAGAAWTGVLTVRGANGTGQHISFRLEPLTCAGTPQVAVTASPPVPAGQQMLIDAGLRFGATLDLAETARQIIDVTVPRFADACAVYVLERPASGGELTGPEAGIEVVARRLATGAARG